MEATSGRARLYTRGIAVGLLLAGTLVAALTAARAQAAFPGRNGKLAIVREFRETQRQVFVGTRSGDLRRLSRGFSFASGPDASPTGRLIAFKGARRGERRQQIWVVRPNGSGLRRLTNHDTDSGGPAFSANGRFLLYDSIGSDGATHNLRRVSLASGASGQLLDGARSAAVSPKGGIIAFVDEPSRGFAEIWTARVDGSRARRLTHERFWVEHPDFSPDGRWVSYLTLRRCRKGGLKRAIVLTTPSGSRSRVLLKGCRLEDISAPVFSPDGRMIVFFQNGVARTVKVNRPGRIGHLLRQRPRRAVDSNLAWSPRPRR